MTHNPNPTAQPDPKKSSANHAAPSPGLQTEIHKKNPCSNGFTEFSYGNKPSADCDKKDLSTLNPAYFSMVMATGIVSIASKHLGMDALAQALFWLNVLIYLILWILTIARTIKHLDKVRGDLMDHQRCAGFFSIIAATGIIASQFLAIGQAAKIAAGIALFGLVLWVIIFYAIFSILTLKHDKPNLPNGIHSEWLVAVVATQAMSVVASRLAMAWGGHNPALLLAAGMWLGGGMLYIWMISLIFYRFTFFPLTTNEIRPPYWINMGAMAISVLAGTALAQASPQIPFITSILPFIKGFTLMFWATATAWIPLLVIMGFYKHVYCRVPIKYDPAYWGAVFPLGMYTAATWKLSQDIGLIFLQWIPWIFIWIAIAAWLATFIGLLHTLLIIFRRQLQTKIRS